MGLGDRDDRGWPLESEAETNAFEFVLEEDATVDDKLGKSTVHIRPSGGIRIEWRSNGMEYIDSLDKSREKD